MSIPSPFIGAPPVPQAIDFFTKTSKIVGACVGKPYIGPVAELLQSVIELYQGNSHHSHALLGLLERCSALVEVIRDQAGYSAEQLQEIQKLNDLLTDIKDKEGEWNALGTLKSLVNQEEMKKYVLEKHIVIDRCVEIFQVRVASSTPLLDWHAPFLNSIGRDNRTILDIVTGNQNALKDMRELSESQTQSIHTLLSKLIDNYGKYDFAASQKFILTIEEITEVLPTNAEMPKSQLDNIEPHSKAGTSFEVRKATRFGVQEVAVKFFRHTYPVEKMQLRLDRMIGMWKVLSKVEREHVLPLIGYSREVLQRPCCIVTPWMRNRDILSYVKEHETVDILYLIYLVAKCLEVFHTREQPIAHGLLKASNILINDEGNPILSDLFLAKFIQDSEDPPPVSFTDATPWSWVSPEIRNANKDAVLTTMSDIYSFGMVVIEIVTKDQPFACYKDVTTPQDSKFITFLAAGNLPKRPQHPIMDDNLWKLLEECWSNEPEKRPTISKIVTELGSKLGSRI